MAAVGGFRVRVSPVVVLVMLAAALLSAPAGAPVELGPTASVSSGGEFQSLDPFRVLDTRYGTGAPVGKVGAGESLTLDVTGVGGVPESGVSAVVVNITVTEPTKSSHLRVHPSGTELPLAANLNWSTGQTIPNLVIAKVGVDGNIVLYNDNGESHFVADIAGWFPEEPEEPEEPVTVRASVDSAGGEGIGGRGASNDPTLSADGDFVAFQSQSSGLVPEDDDGALDVFVKDRNTGSVELISVDSDENNGFAASTDPQITPDGRYVVWESNDSQLVPDDTNYRFDIFVRDRVLGTTEIVSVDGTGDEGDGHSYDADISDDGRFVTFMSYATDLVAGDTNGQGDIFVHDRTTSTTTRVSVDSSGSQADAGSYRPAISGDGSSVAFDSQASNLVAGDTNGVQDVFLHRLSTGATSRVSRNSLGDEAVGQSQFPEIDGIGRYVVFESAATNLIVDGGVVQADANNTFSDVFVHDRVTGETTLVSVDSDEAQSLTYSGDADISADGTRVTYASDASLTATDLNSARDVYVRDRIAGTTTLASVDAGGQPGNGTSHEPAMSPDGTVVAFASAATSLDIVDENVVDDVFVHDLASSTTEQVSTNAAGDGVFGPGGSYDADVSDDGRYVAFDSRMPNLAPDDTDDDDVFIRDLETGVTELVSVDSDEHAGVGTSHDPAVSADGSVVVFASYSSLVGDDGNGVQDIYVRDRVAGTTERVSVDANGTEADGASYEPDVSADGRLVTFRSSATNLVADDTNGSSDIFVHDRDTGVTERVSLDENGAQVADSNAFQPSISGNGIHVAFRSLSSGFVSGDTNSGYDIFVHDRVVGSTTRVSVDALGNEASGSSHTPSLDYDGSHIAFQSSADDLVAGDSHSVDVFVKNLSNGIVELVSVDSDEVHVSGSSSDPRISSLGTKIVFTSSAPYSPIDSGTGSDVYLRDISAGTTTLVSVNTAGLSSDGSSVFPTVSSDGSVVAFESKATDLVADDTNNVDDIFVRSGL